MMVIMMTRLAMMSKVALMMMMIMMMTMLAMMTKTRLMPVCQASCWANYRGTRPLPHANDHQRRHQKHQQYDHKDHRENNQEYNDPIYIYSRDWGPPWQAFPTQSFSTKRPSLTSKHRLKNLENCTWICTTVTVKEIISGAEK